MVNAGASSRPPAPEHPEAHTPACFCRHPWDRDPPFPGQGALTWQLGPLPHSFSGTSLCDLPSPPSFKDSHIHLITIYPGCPFATKQMHPTFPSRYRPRQASVKGVSIRPTSTSSWRAYFERPLVWLPHPSFATTALAVSSTDTSRGHFASQVFEGCGLALTPSAGLCLLRCSLLGSYDSHSSGFPPTSPSAPSQPPPRHLLLTPPSSQRALHFFSLQSSHSS